MSRSRGKFLVFGIVFLLIAGACAAPTPVPPTLAPTPVPPTPVPPTVPPTPVPPTLAPTPDLIGLINAFQEAYNNRDREGLLALFSDDPRYGLTLTPLVAPTTKALRNTLELDFEVNVHLEASDCSTKNDQATCILLITDDCKPPDIDVYHFSTQFTFVDGKISVIYSRWDASEESAVLAYEAARLAWAREALPQDAAVYNDLNEWTKFGGTGDLGLGHLSAIEFGQAVDRICTGYTEAGN